MYDGDLKTATETKPLPLIERVTSDLAARILDREAEKIGKPVLSGPEHDAEVLAWVDAVAERIRQLIDSPLTLPLPEPLPVARRDRFELADLDLGTRITRYDLDHAVKVMSDAREELEFDEDEQRLYDEIESFADRMADYLDTPAVRENYEHEYLNDQLPHDLPMWLNDNIDWDTVYERVTRNMPTFDFQGDTYLIMEGID